MSHCRRGGDGGGIAAYNRQYTSDAHIVLMTLGTLPNCEGSGAALARREETYWRDLSLLVTVEKEGKLGDFGAFFCNIDRTPWPIISR